MVPRSVAISSNGTQSIQYSASFTAAPANTSSPSRLSQLFDILSNDTKVKRPSAPLGLVRSRKEGFKTNFVREPKETTYKIRRIKYPTGRSSFVFGSVPGVYPRYHQVGLALASPMPTVTLGNSALVDSTEKAAKSKFFGKLKNSEFDLAITLAERSKTYVMIANRAALLLKVKTFFKGFWKRVRRRSIQKHESIAVAMANAWLEFYYGWQQLAKDIFAIVGFAASRSMNRWVKTRSFKGNVVNASKTYADTGLAIVATETQSVWVEMKINLNVVADPVLDLTRLSTLNPIAIAWELLPLSFVFDWVLNISNYLAELQTRCMFHCSLGGGYITTTQNIVLKGEFPAQEAVGTFNCVSVPQAIYFSDQYVHKTRVKLLAAPMPSFPTLKSPLSLTHALTTLSLVVQRMSPKGLGRHGRFV